MSFTAHQISTKPATFGLDKTSRGPRYDAFHLGQADGRTDGRAARRTSGREDRQADKRTDGQTDRPRKAVTTGLLATTGLSINTRTNYLATE